MMRIRKPGSERGANGESGREPGQNIDAGARRHPDVFDREWPLRVGDIDRTGRLRLDAACRHIQDIGQDQLREMGFEETHPLWIVRRTMVDLIRPIEFQDMLRCRRWCSGTSNRWCEMRVRIDGRKGGLIESEAFWININRETQMPARIADDFLAGLHKTTSVDRLRWKAYLKPASRDDAIGDPRIPGPSHRHRPVRPHEQLGLLERDRGLPGVAHRTAAGPLRVTIEHEAPVALGDKLEIISHVHPAGSTDQFGPDLADRTVTTLTYAVGDETKAVAAIFSL